MAGKNLDQIILNEESGEHNIPYDVSGLPPGTYLINYTSPEFTKTVKLVKIK